MMSVLRIVSAVALMAALPACGMMPIRLGASATEAPAPDPAAPPKERLVTAIEGQGCVLTATNRDAVLAAAALQISDLPALIQELNTEGRAEAAGEGAIRVMTERCI